MADAAVHIGNMSKSEIVREYYEKCGLETIGPGRITTGEIKMFSTLEGLIDLLQSRSETQQVVVNHGNDTQGLLIPFASGTSFNATGSLIGKLSSLADVAGSGGLSPSSFDVTDAARKMGVTPAAAIRLAEKFAKLRQKKLLIHIRGCNVGKNRPMLVDYKKAFGAIGITAPSCRMFYLRIVPHKPGKGQTVGGLSGQSPTTANTRRRFFDDPIGILWPTIIDIRDIDGHTKVDTESFIEHPKNVPSWAEVIDGQWRQAPLGPGTNQFVLPVMWENTESSYHCPLETGWRQKLVVV